MKKIKIEFTNERIIPASGLAVVGAILGKSDFVKRCNRMDVTLNRSQHQIKNGDILLTYIGLLTMGKPAYVWITKYCKPVITRQIAIRTRELIRMVCQSNEVEILAGYVGSDHIHLLVSVPPHISASKLVQYIKRNTSRKLQMEYKELNKQFWRQHLWARGYFVANSGNVTDEIIKGYIKNQDLQERSNSDNFEIGEK